MYVRMYMCIYIYMTFTYIICCHDTQNKGSCFSVIWHFPKSKRSVGFWREQK